MLNNKIFMHVVSIVLMLTFILIAWLFLTDRSIFGDARAVDGDIVPGAWYNMNNIILMLSFCIILVVAFLVASSVLGKNDKIDNEKSIFSIKYWKESSKEIKDIKKLIFISIMLAIMIMSRNFAIPFGTMFITWRFVPFAMIAIVVGPVGTIIIGLMYTVLAWMLFIPAPFFFPALLDRAIEGLVYGVLLYKTKITLAKIITLVFITSFIVSTIMNGMMLAIFLWELETIEQIRMFIIANRFPRDAIMFLPQIVLIYLTSKFMIPTLKLANFIDEQIPDNVSLI